MSAAASEATERVRVWRVVPEAVHPDVEVDCSAIEPATGLTQRAARELADERNRRRVPEPTVRWVAEATARVADWEVLITWFNVS